MKKLTTFAVLWLSLSPLFGPVAFAGGYKLLRFIPGGRPSQEFPISSGDLELCEAYEKVLNSSSQASYPLACGASMDTEFQDPKKPKWNLLDAKGYRHLIKKMDKIRHHTKPFSDQDWEKSFNSRVILHEIRLSLAQPDIVEQRYRFFAPTNVPRYILEYYPYYAGPCDPSADWSYKVRDNRYFFTDEGLTDVKEIGGLGWSSLCGVLTYKGAIYFEAFQVSTWNDRGSKTGADQHYENYIYEYREVRGQPVVLPICRYKYIENSLPRE